MANQEDAKKIEEEFLNTPVIVPDKVESEKTEPADELVLSNKRRLKIKPTKIKYFKNNDISIYRIIQAVGAATSVGMSNGFDSLCMFLSAVFDKPFISEQVKDDITGEYSTKIVFDSFIEDLMDDLTAVDVDNLVKVFCAVNEIKENFQAPLARMMGNQE